VGFSGKQPSSQAFSISPDGSTQHSRAQVESRKCCIASNRQAVQQLGRVENVLCGDPGTRDQDYVSDLLIDPD
jgi:hypothetical protein